MSDKGVQTLHTSWHSTSGDTFDFFDDTELCSIRKVALVGTLVILGKIFIFTKLILKLCH
jgi:hypothetical protein